MSTFTYESVFGKSPEVAVGATKYPTSLKIYLGPSPMGPSVTPYPPGTVLKVDTKITIRIGIYSTEEGKFITSQGVYCKVLRKINTGAWETIYTARIDTEDALDIAHTLTKAGTHTFYMEWTGTDKYEGCRAAVRVLAR